MTERLVYIYMLTDPTGANTCYLGRSHDPRARLKEHMNDLWDQSAKCGWLRMLKHRGLLPKLTYIEKVKREESKQAEADLIGILKAIRGPDCVNK